jgi:hypothetical protein
MKKSEDGGIEIISLSNVDERVVVAQASEMVDHARNSFLRAD